MKQRIEIEVDIPEGYEATGELGGQYRVWPQGLPCGAVRGDVILRKKFQWPSWLKAAAIARDKNGKWNAFRTTTPDKTEDCWIDWSGRWLVLDTDILDIDLPDVPWEQSLIVNPNGTKETT